MILVQSFQKLSNRFVDHETNLFLPNSSLLRTVLAKLRPWVGGAQWHTFGAAMVWSGVIEIWSNKAIKVLVLPFSFLGCFGSFWRRLALVMAWGRCDRRAFNLDEPWIHWTVSNDKRSLLFYLRVLRKIFLSLFKGSLTKGRQFLGWREVDKALVDSSHCLGGG